MSLLCPCRHTPQASDSPWHWFTRLLQEGEKNVRVFVQECVWNTVRLCLWLGILHWLHREEPFYEHFLLCAHSFIVIRGGQVKVSDIRKWLKGWIKENVICGFFMHLHVKATNNSPTASEQTAFWKWSTLRSPPPCPYTVVCNARPAACCLCDVMAAFNCTQCVIWRLTGRSFSRLLSTLPPLPLLLSYGSLPHFHHTLNIQAPPTKYN